MRLIKKRKLLLFISVFLFSICLCTLVTRAYIVNRCKLEQIEMEQLVTEKSEKVSTVITKLLYKANTLAALVVQNDGEVKDFERVASTILDDPSIRNVLLAPNGVVTHIYPLEGNEQAIGLDFYQEGAGNKEAILAKKTGDLVLGGPFKLVQGGQSLVGRIPVYLTRENGSKDFWGIASVTLNYPDALVGAELDHLKSQGFTYEIWRINPDDNNRQTIASGSADVTSGSRFVEKPLDILNANWNFRLSPIRNWYQFSETWIFSFVGLIVSLLVAFLCVHNYELKKVHYELENLTYKDALTGILNRRGIFSQVQTLLANPDKPFLLCYMDINHFKQINDTYGHNAGDNALCRFAIVFQSYLAKDHLFGRIGGDEFVLVFKNTDDLQDITAFLEQVQSDLSKNVAGNFSMENNLTFSVGTSCFPKDGQNIDDLINIADQYMYHSKQSFKKQ